MELLPGRPPAATVSRRRPHTVATFRGLMASELLSDLSGDAYCRRKKTGEEEMQLKVTECRWKSTVLARLDGSIIVPADDWSLTCSDGEVFARVYRARAESDSASAWKWTVLLGSGTDHTEVGCGAAQTRAGAIRACEERIALVVRVLESEIGAGAEFLSRARIA
jgi:hypothetical protein